MARAGWWKSGTALVMATGLAFATPAGLPLLAAPPPTQVGTTFRDCADCPEMVVVPAGSFMMGSPADGAEGDPAQSPRHRVTITEPFAVGRLEVTFAEWEACVAAGDRSQKPGDEGWGRGRRPVINVSWEDIRQQYLPWLSRRTGKAYRLPSEAEWEYAARAGTLTAFSYGPTITPGDANCGAGKGQTVEVGGFSANAFGLHDMHGNVWEWTEDPWHDSYVDAPVDGPVWAAGGDRARRAVRGGSWGSVPGRCRAAFRYGNAPDDRDIVLGFRVARALTP